MQGREHSAPRESKNENCDRPRGSDRRDARSGSGAARDAEAESRDVEEATVKDMFGPAPAITATEITRNDKLLPATKSHMLALAERASQRVRRLRSRSRT